MRQTAAGVFVAAPGVADRQWRALTRYIAAEDLERAWRGVYLRRARSDQIIARLHALERSVGVPLIGCHATSAAFHRFDVTADPRLHVTTEDGRSLRQRPGVVVHQIVPRSDPVIVDGVAVLAPADAAVDLASTVPEIDVLAVLDAAMRCDVAISDLDAAIDRAKGRRGLARVRSWAPYADWRAESPMESRTRQRFLAAGFPAPDLQVEVRTATGSHRYPDCGWRQFRVGVDYDGQQAHGGAGERDRQRHNEIADVGWRMFYPTARDVYDRDGRFLEMVAQALVRAGYRQGFGVRVSPASVPRPAPGRASLLLRLPRSAWPMSAAA